MMQLRNATKGTADAVIQKKRNFLLSLAALGTAALLSIVLTACLGTVKIAPLEALQILLYKIFQLNLGETISQISAAHMDIIWKIRFPRILMAAIVGAGLAVCGTAMQSSVQNPLADPYILGISAGASLGATFAILIHAAAGGMGVAFWAFAGALTACVLVMALSTIGGQMSTIKMILAGTIANALFIALSNCIIYLAGNAEGIRTVTFWTMGSLAAAKWHNLALPAAGVLAGCLFFLAQSRNLNTMLLGEEAAITLGIDLAKVRRNNLIMTALVTGLIVANCGVIAFVGLIIPHIVRGFVGSDHRRLLPSVILTGILFLIWADVLARSILPSGELPIGIITAMIGAPFFLYILYKNSLGFAGK